MNELENLLSNSESTDHKAITKYFYFLKSNPLTKDKEIAFMCIETAFFPNAIAFTENLFIELTDKAFDDGIKIKFQTKWIETALTEAIIGIMDAKFKIHMKNHETEYVFESYSKKHVKQMHTLSLMILGSILAKENQSDISSSDSIHTNTVNAKSVDSTKSDNDIRIKLTKLKSLFEDELITKEEYESKKSELLKLI